MNASAWPSVENGMIHFSSFRRLCVGLVFGFAFSQALGQLPTARMTAVFPLGCQIGEETEVQVHGADLEGAAELIFSHPGITAELTNAAERKFKVGVAANVPTGVYEVRFVGALGLSNSRLFAVSTLDESRSPSGNTSMKTAATLGDDSVVNGVCEVRLSSWFQVEAKKGQRLLLRISAKSLDSRMSPVMLLRSEVGERLARTNADGLIDFTAPVNGNYLIQVHDAIFRGGTELFFRLENSSGAHVDFVSPPIVPSFSESEITLFGRNLPGSKPAGFKAADGQALEQLSVKISELTQTGQPGGVVLPPAAIVLDGGVFRLPGNSVASNPFFVGLRPGNPLTMEQGGNDTADRAQRIPTPGLVAGSFYPARDVDCFMFLIKKNEVYWLDVFSQRLGCSTNPYVTAQLVGVSKDGKESPEAVKEFYDSKDNPGGRGFNVSNRDMSWRFQAKAEGHCRVMLRDLFNQSTDDPSRGYVVALRRERPGFRLVVHPQTVAAVWKKNKIIELMATHLRKGSTLPVEIIVLREGNFTGPITITAEGLPKGVELHHCRVKANQKAITAFLTASEPVASFIGDVRFVGKAMVGDREVEQAAWSTETIHRVGDYDKEAVFSRVAKECALSINAEDVEPIQVTTVGDVPFTGFTNGKVKIPLKVKRTGEYNESIKLKVFGISQLDKLGELEVKKDQGEATLEIDLAKFKVPVGRYTFHLASTVKGKYQYPPLNGKKTDKKKDITYQMFSPPIVLEVAAALKPLEKVK